MKQFSETLLKRSGGWFIPIAVIASLVAGLFGAIPGLASLGLLAPVDGELSRLLLVLIPILYIASQLVLVAYAWFITPFARERLDAWRNGTALQDEEEESAAWADITKLTPRIGAAAFITTTLFIVLPPFVISVISGGNISSILQPSSTDSSLPIYILLGGLASILGWVVLTLLLLERFTLSCRLVLLPRNFENQIQAQGGVLLGVKFQVLIIGIIAIGVAIVAPVGFQQTIRALYTETSSIQIFRELQIQSIVLSILVVALGLGFSYFATRSISDPVRELRDVFQKVELGDLKQRVPVSGTDELATVAMQFNRMVSRLQDLQSTLEHQVKERTKQLTATLEVGRVASAILDPDQLIGNVVNLIADRFGYYYVAIYLLDSSQKWAELREATGHAGDVLKKNHHRLEVTGRGMVSSCIRDRSPAIAHDTTGEKQWHENPLLPYTRSQIALPLIAGDRVLGALDVQSTKSADFGKEVIDIMQNMAGQVAIALENARLYQEAQQSIAELRSIQKQYLFEGWTNIKSFNEDLEYAVGEPSEVASQQLESPISLRDQVLGRITLEGRNEWTPEQQSLVNAVTGQAAIALENARLVSESRLIALRERTLAEINSKIWAAPSIDSILQTVVKELGRRLGAENASIELSLDDEHDDS